MIGYQKAKTSHHKETAAIEKNANTVNFTRIEAPAKYTSMRPELCQQFVYVTENIYLTLERRLLCTT